jgi:CMP/dCMP kinase
MEKKHIITIAGKPGSGKSTTSKKLATTLNYSHFSSGDLFRSIGQARGIDVLATNQLAESEKNIDYLVDQKLQEIGLEQDNLVIDSRMAWHWMPYSFKVYLDLDFKIAAARILNGLDEARRAVENIPADPGEYATLLQARQDSEAKRYLDLYQVNPYDHKNYDLVIDTAENSIVAVHDLIQASYHKWL